MTNTAAPAPTLEYRTGPANPPSLTRLAVTGSAWTAIGYGGSQILRLAGNVIVSRLLFPEAFGLMALVMAFMMGLEMFSDLGVGPSIVRSPSGDSPRFLDTAWTLQVIRGTLLWVVSFAIAWPAAWFYEEPSLVTLLPVLGLTALISGLNATSLFTLNRRMAFRTVTLIELGAQLASVIVMVTWAWLYPSVWALAAGTITQYVLRLIASHLLSIARMNRVCWDRDAVHELFHFGKWIFLSTLLTFVVGQADRLVFGKLGAMSWLGVYSIAVALAALPSVVILRIGSTVTFPAYSRVRDAGGDLPAAFRASRLPLLIAGGLMVTCLIVAGPAAVTLLYDQRYHGAGVILQLLAVGVWFQVLECTNGALLLAVGDARVVAIGNAAKLLVMAAGIAVGYRLAGIHGAILGLCAGDAARYAVSALATRRHGMNSLAPDLGLTALVAAASLASIALLRLLPHHLPAERFTRFAISVVPPLLIWTIPASAVIWHSDMLRGRLMRLPLIRCLGPGLR